MAGSSDKARFYLEQSIPELHELERKKIFTKDEISSIAKKRSEFEHKINARGSKPLDYARYAEFEMNLESLRRKRVSRLGIKAGNHAGQRRILFVLDRATRKFHGDLALWTQYIEAARQQKAFKKVYQILTNLVRLHPGKPEVWIYAANYAFQEHADMNEARSYMQRGLRFCKHSRQLWLLYAKLELLYIAKIAARRKILGLDEGPPKQDVNDADDDPDADMLALPAITAEDVDPSLRRDDEQDRDKLQKLNSTPALSGAIPIAIFSAAMDQFKDEEFGTQFFDTLAEIGMLPCSNTISQKMVDRLLEMAPRSASCLDAYVREPLVGVSTTTSDFPKALKVTLSRLKGAQGPEYPSGLTYRTIKWITSYLKAELDPDVRTVLMATLSNLVHKYQTSLSEAMASSEEETALLVEVLRASKIDNIHPLLLEWGLEKWPSSVRMRKLKEEVPGDSVAAQ